MRSSVTESGARHPDACRTRESVALLHCVRSALFEEAPRSSVDVGGVDWQLVSAMAERHRVQPLLYEAIRKGAIDGRIPPEADSALRVGCHHTAMRQEWMSHRTADLLRAAQRAGIELMLLKGPVLASLAYARPEHRSFADVDLLVREDDFHRLHRALRNLGYQSAAPELPGRDLPRYAHCVQQIRFRAPSAPPAEIHFRLFNLGIPASREPAWDDAERITFQGVPARCPSAERFLLHLCLHAQQHAFRVLRLMVDIAVWLRTQPIDPARFIGLARRHHLATTAYFALTYTAELLGCRDGREMIDALRPPAWRRRLFERLWNHEAVTMLRAESRPMEAELPRMFLLGEAPVFDKALYVWNVLLPPVAWLARAAGNGKHVRVRHLKRIWNGARRGLR